MKKERDRMNRRKFLKDGMAPVALGAGCLKFGLKDAFAQARKAGKPLFSVERLNALVPSKPNDTYISHAKEAESDPLGFARKYFHLTSKQEEVFASLSPTDIEKIRKAIRTALEKNYRVRVTHNRTQPRAAQPRRGMRLVSGKRQQISISIGVDVDCKASGSISRNIEADFQGECRITISVDVDC